MASEETKQDYPIPGEDLSPSAVGEALRLCTRIITDAQFSRMVAMTDSDAF